MVLTASNDRSVTISSIGFLGKASLDSPLVVVAERKVFKNAGTFIVDVVVWAGTSMSGTRLMHNGPSTDPGGIHLLLPLLSAACTSLSSNFLYGNDHGYNRVGPLDGRKS